MQAFSPSFFLLFSVSLIKRRRITSKREKEEEKKKVGIISGKLKGVNSVYTSKNNNRTTRERQSQVSWWWWCMIYALVFYWQCKHAAEQMYQRVHHLRKIIHPITRFVDDGKQLPLKSLSWRRRRRMWPTTRQQQQQQQQRIIIISTMATHCFKAWQTISVTLYSCINNNINRQQLFR